MRRTLTLAALLALSACGQQTFSVQPPNRYTGDADVVVRFVEPEQVPQACARMIGPAPAGEFWNGCEKGGVIILPNPCRWANDSDYRQLACHEMAHANGWPANHPSS